MGAGGGMAVSERPSRIFTCTAARIGCCLANVAGLIRLQSLFCLTSVSTQLATCRRCQEAQGQARTNAKQNALVLHTSGQPTTSTDYIYIYIYGTFLFGV